MATGPIQNQPSTSTSVTPSSQRGSVVASSGGRLKQVQPNIISRAISWVKAQWNVGSTRKELLNLYNQEQAQTPFAQDLENDYDQRSPAQSAKDKVLVQATLKKLSPDQAKAMLALANSTKGTPQFNLLFDTIKKQPEAKLAISVASDVNLPTAMKLVELVGKNQKLRDACSHLTPDQAKTFLRLAVKSYQRGDDSQYNQLISNLTTRPETRIALTYTSKLSDEAVLHLVNKGTQSDFASIDRIFKKVKDPSAYGVLADLLVSAAGQPTMKALEANLLNNPKRTENILELLGYVQQTVKGKVPPEQLRQIASVFFTLNDPTLQEFDQFIEATLALRNVPPDQITKEGIDNIKKQYGSANMALSNAFGESNSEISSLAGWGVIRAIFTDAFFRSVVSGTVFEDLFAIQSPTSEGLEVQKTRAILAPKSNALESCGLRTQLLPHKIDSSGKMTVRLALSEKKGGIRVVEVPLPIDFDGNFSALVEAVKKQDMSNPIIRMSEERLREANFSLDHPPSQVDSVKENVIYVLSDGKLSLLPQASPTDPRYTIQALEIPQQRLLNADPNVGTATTPQGLHIENGVQIAFNYTAREINLTLTKSGIEHSFTLTRQTKGTGGALENESDRALLERFANEELEQQLLVLQSKILTKSK